MTVPRWFMIAVVVLLIYIAAQLVYQHSKDDGARGGVDPAAVELIENNAADYAACSDAGRWAEGCP